MTPTTSASTVAATPYQLPSAPKAVAIRCERAMPRSRAPQLGHPARPTACRAASGRPMTALRRAASRRPSPTWIGIDTSASLAMITSASATASAAGARERDAQVVDGRRREARHPDQHVSPRGARRPRLSVVARGHARPAGKGPRPERHAPVRADGLQRRVQRRDREVEQPVRVRARHRRDVGELADARATRLVCEGPVDAVLAEIAARAERPAEERAVHLERALRIRREELVPRGHEGGRRLGHARHRHDRPSRTAQHLHDAARVPAETRRALRREGGRCGLDVRRADWPSQCGRAPRATAAAGSPPLGRGRGRARLRRTTRRPGRRSCAGRRARSGGAWGSPRHYASFLEGER